MQRVDLQYVNITMSNTILDGGKMNEFDKELGSHREQKVVMEGKG